MISVPKSTANDNSQRLPMTGPGSGPQPTQADLLIAAAIHRKNQKEQG